MKRWNTDMNRFEEVPEVDAFIAEIETLCEKHGFSIAHEDGQGAFVIVPLGMGDMDWIRSAHWKPPF